MYTFLFGLIITVLTGIVASLASKVYKSKFNRKLDRVDEKYIIFDLLGMFRKQKSASHDSKVRSENENMTKF